ncbi:hypothetical protein L1987_36932 [Smallanthus sonchifolius]|uniref:Uncharacterized protein n=1 Tax=Smallanthus sonchifolius TaxID=185202 RepID=A0ACB9HEI2_9ASTR|nr:hypothetical protein L1987_36932 [Smallanthus sonchifolius]
MDVQIITQLKAFLFSFINIYRSLNLTWRWLKQMMNETNPTGSELASTSESKPLGVISTDLQEQQQQEEVNTQAASLANTRRLTPNLPKRYLFAGPRENYLKIGIHLYEASIKCDWKAAKAILDKKPELIRYSITENGETALHIAASVKRSSKQVENFVKNLVDLMEKENLELENENFNTALYLAAVAGNIKTVKIMVEKNRALVAIPGAGKMMMPLYAAALFGNYEVVKYLYECSKELRDDGWTPQNRGWLLEKCVEADMFDVALKIVKHYPQLGSRFQVLDILARKPAAFSKTKSNIIKRSINSVFALIGLTVEAYEKESKALQLLKFIWKDIAKKPKNEIDSILRGQPDSVKREKLTSERAVQVLHLKNLIYEHIDKLEIETHNIITGPSDASKQDIRSASGLHDQALQLEKLISKHLVNMHVETQNLVKQENKTVSDKRDKVSELKYAERTIMVQGSKEYDPPFL